MPNYNKIIDDVTSHQLLQNISIYNVFHFAGHASVIHKTNSWNLICNDRELNIIELIKLMNNTFLANLAGCRTGVQTALKTGDLISMAGVFVINQVPKFIGNLWPVHDKMAVNFSEKFYDYWLNKNHSVSESVRLAMLDNKRDFPNPYRWGSPVIFD